MSSSSAVSEFVYVQAANLYLVMKPARDSKKQAAEKLKSDIGRSSGISELC